MDSLLGDPELAAEMVGLMGRELKTTRKKAGDLEQELMEERKRISTLEDSHKLEKERAEAAEYTRDIFKLNMEKFADQNKRLNRELEHIQKTYSKEIKKENEEFILAKTSTKGQAEKERNSKMVVEKKTPEGEFVELQSKYDVQLGENEALRQACEALESRVNELETEKEDLNKKLEAAHASGQQKALEMETQIKRMEAQMSQISRVHITHEQPQRESGPKVEQNLEMYLERPDFKEFLSKFSIPPAHPQFHRLYAVQDSRKDLSQYLPPILSVARCSTNFMHFPGRLTWPTSMSYALAFSPFSTIGACLGSWERSSEVSSLRGYVRELFYSNNTSVYYAGTFRCIQTSKWFPEGIHLPSGVVSHSSTFPLSRLNALFCSKSAEAVAEVALKHNTSSAPYKAAITKSFADGTIKSECMVLECVGFNHYLYDALLEKYSPNTSSKRSIEHNDKDDHKRPRRDRMRDQGR